MNGESLFCWVIAAVCLLYALFSGLQLLRVRRTTAVTIGTIVSIVRLPNPDAKTHLNAHWAQVAYTVNSRNLISENRAQVARTAVIGSPVRVRYDTSHPSQLRQISPQRSLAALAVTLIFVVLAVLLH